MVCFVGKYRTEPQTKKNNTNDEEQFDIYEVMVMALKIGIRLDDFNNMDYPMLINLIDASIPKVQKEPKQRYRMATQQDIDMII